MKLVREDVEMGIFPHGEVDGGFDLSSLHLAYDPLPTISGLKDFILWTSDARIT